MSTELRAAAIEVVRAESIPPLDQCHGMSVLCVPVQAWLSAKAVACDCLIERVADEHKPATAEWMMTLPGAVNTNPGKNNFPWIKIGLVEVLFFAVFPHVAVGGCRIWHGQTVTRGMIMKLIQALKGGG